MELSENPIDDLMGKTLLERFHITGKLGQGGMGAIYTAHDSILDRDVAIKTIARTNLNDQELMRFQREAKAASTLRHPNVIQMLDFGVLESGQPYMVMELIQGISLAQLIAEKGPQSPGLALQIIEQVANGMIAVHKSGIVHRDLKTGNIMLLSAGKLTDRPLIKILDFGIAKSLGPDAQFNTLTKAGQIFGSPNSMSPEQARGELLDQRSDIYSLGCISFELLTGQPLFEGESLVDIVTKHINEEPPRLWEACDLTFPMELERLVAHMVLKKPEDRFQSMEEVIKDLREVYSVLPDDFTASSDCESSEPDAPNLHPKSVKLNTMSLVIAVSAVIALIGLTSYIVSTQILTPESKPLSKSKLKNLMESESFKLDMADDIHTNSDFASFALNHSGRVTQRLEDLIAKNRFKREILLIDSEIVPDDASLIAKLQPQMVNLSGSVGITEKVMKGLSSIPSIHFLDLTRVKGLTPTTLAYLEKLPRLEILSLVDCDLTDEHLKALRNLKHLFYIRLARNKRVTLNGIRYLGGKKHFLKIETDQPSIVVLKASQRQKLENDDQIVLVKTDRLDEDLSSEKVLNKYGKSAMDKLLPIGDSKQYSGVLDALPKDFP